MKCRINDPTASRKRLIRDSKGRAIGRTYLPEDCEITAEELTENRIIALMQKLIPTLEDMASTDLNLDGTPVERKDTEAVTAAETVVIRELNCFLGTENAESLFKAVRPFALTQEGFFIQRLIEVLPDLFKGKQ